MSTRAAIGNLIESMDFCDATRSHESMPSRRLRHKRWPAIVGWTAVAVIALAALAVFAR